ncbi:39S ribosomal protein L37, mitochondrial [Diprion similis]|uniref:39S ribosomal protein L37, mitochondrial n=1 Tax=Diprion similis TaxID=362088 RepID=UPI001EF90C96|nr:39S ribosomal protein L37, mitochondrial [Diprion similis]
MKFSSSLCAQHLGRMIRRHWYIQGNRPILDTPTESYLKSQNIEIIDPEILLVKPLPERLKLNEPLIPLPVPNDKTHPNWKEKPCLSYRDHNVLLEGVEQAKVLTKTVEIVEGLPESVNNLITEHDERVEQLVLRVVQNSTIYDAYQERLPKPTDPERPGFIFPRPYGISALRKVRNLSQKLLQLCESLSGPQVAFERNLIHNGVVSLPIEKDEKQLQFELRADILVTSSSPLKPIASKDEGNHIQLSNLHPIDSTITLEKENIYTLRNFYPIEKNSQWMNVHTIFAHFNPREVKNIYETPVTESQILGRSLLKSFAVGAACARQRFGNEVSSLPEPVTIQCIQSDGKMFHFSVLQINTLDLDGSGGEKNIWWSAPNIDLYETAGYEGGVPKVQNYNPEVFRRIFAFYNNN